MLHPSAVVISAYILLVLLCVGCYYNSLTNDFAFDDYLAIVNNPDVGGSSSSSNNATTATAWATLWRNDIWGKHLLEVDSHRSYRPLLATLFKAIVHGCGGGLRPGTFRAVSIALHCAATWAVAHLARHTCGSNTLGLGAAVLFAAHPVHVEAVAAVVNMAEAACLVCCVAAYFVYDTATAGHGGGGGEEEETWPGGGSSSSSSSSSSLWGRVGSATLSLLRVALWLLCLTAAVLFKETGITLCGVVVAASGVALLSALRRERCASSAAARPAHYLRTCTQWASRHALWVAASFYALLLYFVFRAALVAPDGFLPTFSVLLSPDPARWRAFRRSVATSYLGESQLIRRAENPFSFLRGQERVLSMMYLHFRYFYQLLWPAELCAEYAFDCIPSVRTWDDPRAHLAVAFYTVLGVAVLIGAWRLVMPSTRERRAAAVAATRAAWAEKKTDGNADPPTTAKGQAQQPPLPTVTVDPLPLSASPEAFVLACVWLVVPFVPASGLFLRLGTLLAERLLYAPSVGYCMLQAMAVHAVSRRIARAAHTWLAPSRSPTPTPTPTPASTSPSRPAAGATVLLHVTLYWGCVAAITAAYAAKTVSQNRHWANDETLHTHDHSVCPRSAKVNTQLAKLYMGKSDLATARRFIDTARDIDPDFCDADHQHALLLMFHEQDFDAAMDVLADNLKCIYTNKQSFELLNKVWAEQLAMPGAEGNYNLLGAQAALALRGGLTPAAGQKYQAASALAFKRGDWGAALTYSLEAEATVAKILSEPATDAGVGSPPAPATPLPTPPAPAGGVPVSVSVSAAALLRRLLAAGPRRPCKADTCPAAPDPRDDSDAEVDVDVDVDALRLLMSYNATGPLAAAPAREGGGGRLLEAYGAGLGPQSTEHALAVADLACNVYLSGARLRAHLRALSSTAPRRGSKTKTKTKTPPAETFRPTTRQARELARAEELYWYAARPHCVVVMGGRTVGDHASPALTDLSERLTVRTRPELKVQAYVARATSETTDDDDDDDEDEDEEEEGNEERDAAVEEYARFCEASAHVLDRLHFLHAEPAVAPLRGPVASGATGAGPAEYGRSARDMWDTAMTLWRAHGHALYARGSHRAAARSFLAAARAGFYLAARHGGDPRRVLSSSLLWFANALAADDDTAAFFGTGGSGGGCGAVYAAAALRLVVAMDGGGVAGMKARAAAQLQELLTFLAAKDGEDRSG